MHDVVHRVVAVGSRKVETAQEFIGANAGGDTNIKAYGTYEEVYADKVRISLLQLRFSRSVHPSRM